MGHVCRKKAFKYTHVIQNIHLLHKTTHIINAENLVSLLYKREQPNNNLNKNSTKYSYTPVTAVCCQKIL